MRRSDVTEEALIERYFARPGRRRRADVVLGIGDDAAVTRIGAGYDLVIATDALFEGVHFPRGTPPRALGHRCLAVNLSDLAAMGAEPRWATLALSLPVAREDWLKEFARGFFGLADASGTELVGGDTVRGPLGMSVTVHGRVRPGAFARRSGARPGDGIYLTGHAGDAVAGRLRAGGRPDALARRFLFPEPRWREGRALARLASAMIDVSDGLHDDLGKLMRASGCGADALVEALPLSRALVRYAGPGASVELALTGGDDYELLFTLPDARAAELRRISRRWPCAVTRIGTAVARRGVRWTRDGRPFRFTDRTFRHFDGRGS